MWIMLNNSFLSIVQHNQDRGLLLVRARVKGDIERAFGPNKVTVIEGAGTDYQYRAAIPRVYVEDMLRHQLRSINYTNFKASVEDDDRHDAYISVWAILAKCFWGK